MPRLIIAILLGVLCIRLSLVESAADLATAINVLEPGVGAGPEIVHLDPARFNYVPGSRSTFS